MGNVIEVTINDLFDENNILRHKSTEVDIVDISSLYGLINNMKKEILLSSHATGISAIQLGSPLRVFVINMKREKNRDIVAINPRVISISGRMQKRLEGCLSLPNYSGKVKRRNKISFLAIDMEGIERQYEFEGYTAAVIQHEFDHLDGILYWDRMENAQLPNKRVAYDNEKVIEVLEN